MIFLTSFQIQQLCCQSHPQHQQCFGVGVSFKVDNDGSINLLLVNWIAKMSLSSHSHKLLSGNEDLIATMVDHPEMKKETHSDIGIKIGGQKTSGTNCQSEENVDVGVP